MATGVQGAGRGTEREVAPEGSRIERAERHGAGDEVRRLLAVGRAGLPLAIDAGSGDLVQTVRRAGGAGSAIRQEGTSLRYTAIAALGLSRLPELEQRQVLGGRTAAEMADAVGTRAVGQPDPGAVALAAWAVAEISGTAAPELLSRLGRDLSGGRPLPTVDLSWMVTAALAAGSTGEAVAALAAARLLEGQGDHGVFPHVLPARSQNRWRRHVGSFADQVYPLQALARMFRATGDRSQLDAAEAAADRICELQGPDGQWWWHYDVRTGDVVERFPVYSVHQHAMAPMTLFDLADAGGRDRTAEVVRGLEWIRTHPEVDEDLVDESLGVIWRKAGRHEPPKAVRRISAVTTSLRPGLRLPLLDRAFPVDRVDHECRPYELGWLLYAWLPGRGEGTS
ncbi:MAG: hypothetical protein ABW004_05140 [Aeromicrobium sp.]